MNGFEFWIVRCSRRLSAGCRLTMGLLSGLLLAALGRAEPTPLSKLTRTVRDRASRPGSPDNTVVFASPDRRAKDGNAIGANGGLAGGSPGGSTIAWPAHLRNPERFLHFSTSRRATAARRFMNQFLFAAVTRPANPRAPPEFQRWGTYFPPACVVA